MALSQREAASSEERSIPPANEILTRAAASIGTVDPEKRTVELIFATSTPVRRYSWEEGGYYNEVLTIGRDAIDTTRMDAGSVSLLDTHDQYSMDSRLGSVVAKSFRVEGDKAICTVKFSRRERADAFFQDIADGLTTPVSVGYRILESVKSEGQGDSLPTITATRWMPLEVSLCPVPADGNSHTRSHEDESMTTPTTEGQQRPTNIIHERKRVKDIRDLGRSAQLTDEVIDRAVDEGQTVEAFRAAMLDTLVERQAASPTFPMVETRGVGGDDRGEVNARVEALACRMSGEKPSERARQYMSWTLEQHARASLEAAGVNTRNLSRDEVFAGRQRGYAMHTTSDFPILLQSAGERILMTQYEAAQSPIKTHLSRSTTMSDFRKSQKVRVGDIDTLAPLNEHGEVKATTRGESAESYGLSTFARIFSLSRNAQINDDLSGLADWSRAAGRAAAETENQIIVNLLLSNPQLGEDSKALFHADHNNLAPVAAPLSLDGISAARKAMRKQRAYGGKLLAGVTPAFLVVGPEFETLAEKLLATLAASRSEDVNPFAGKLELLVEDRIPDYQWYVFATPVSAPVIEWAHLSSAPGPQIAYREGFETLGTDFRVHLDFGAGIVDFRGAYKNAGAAPVDPEA